MPDTPGRTRDRSAGRGTWRCAGGGRGETVGVGHGSGRQAPPLAPRSGQRTKTGASGVERCSS
ncbi:hypothetical protein FBF34_00900 [Arachnia propionica]|nr:hypothetical protein FBF34_00900 [Arachnia propionica]RPA19376.1 hypothetical protein EGT56_07675 [Arachnia propionica]